MTPVIKLEGKAQRNKIQRFLLARMDADPNHTANTAPTNANCRTNRMVFVLLEKGLFSCNDGGPIGLFLSLWHSWDTGWSTEPFHLRIEVKRIWFKVAHYIPNGWRDGRGEYTERRVAVFLTANSTALKPDMWFLLFFQYPYLFRPRVRMRQRAFSSHDHF